MKKNNAVTGFRGIVIFLIIFHHYSDRYSEIFLGSMSITFPIVSHYGGMLGNIIFMVMTGFFMTKSLTENKGGVKAVCQYAINRYWRFWPSYALAVLIILIFMFYLPLPARVCDMRTILIDFFFIYHPGFSSIDGSHWFLSKILLIQLLLSSVLFVKEVKIRVWVLYAFAIFNVLALIVGNCLDALGDYNYTLLYIFSVLTGILLSLAGERRIWIVLFCSSIVFLVFFNTPRVSIPTILFLSLFVLIVRYPNHFRILDNKFLVFVGTISFSWYLVHQNIGFTIMYYVLPKGEISNLWLFVPLMSTIIIAYIIDIVVRKLPSKIL